MRIDPKVTTQAVTSESKDTPTRARPRSSTGAQAAVVKLTAAGAAIAETKSHDITTRLETIKAMIDAGDYPVDLDKLAERIVDDEVVRSGGKAT